MKRPVGRPERKVRNANIVDNINNGATIYGEAKRLNMNVKTIFEIYHRGMFYFDGRSVPPSMAKKYPKLYYSDVDKSS